MKKFFLLAMIAALLMAAVPVFAGGGKVQSDKAKGSANANHMATGNDGDAPGYVWWD